MPAKPDHKVYLRQLRRDIFAVSSIFLLILLGLWAFGALTALVGAIAAVAGVICALGYYLRRGRDGEANQPDQPVAEPTDDTLTARTIIDIKRSVLDGLDQPALLVSAGQIKVRNQAAIDLFNLPDNQINLPVVSLRDPGLLTAIETVVLTGEQAECVVKPARNPDQTWLCTFKALEQTSAHQDILIVLTDQKPVRLAERARADFLANASHELRTPLTSISGFIETMKGPAKDDFEVWPRFIDIMDEQTRHMKDLIGGLLSLSRIELSGHVMPDKRLDLGQAVAETLAALQHTGDARGLTLNLQRPEDPLLLMGDEGEIKQVVRNLVENAMKYAPENTDITLTLGASVSLDEAQTQAARSWAGAGRITLRAPEQKTGSAVWFQVRDHGQGVAQEYLPRLGERFFRVDDSRGGPIEGTGLGLAIVKHIIARHRGGFAVESRYGEGASFSVWFPSAI